LGSTIGDFSGRFDLDAAVYWELRNFGLGEKAKRQEMAARQDQAQAMQVRMMDRVAREVVESGTQVRSRKSQIEVAESGIRTATASYDRNLTRIREGQGLPIEVLQSLQALDESQREYLRTVADYNEAQFRLQRALGWPIQ
jgi:outer membrane protein TolC